MFKKILSNLLIASGAIIAGLISALALISQGRKQANIERENAFNKKKEQNTDKGKEIEKDYKDLDVNDAINRLNSLSNNKGRR